jgi:hypothetical protein
MEFRQRHINTEDLGRVFCRFSVNIAARPFRKHPLSDRIPSARRPLCFCSKTLGLPVGGFCMQIDHVGTGLPVQGDMMSALQE